MNRKKSETLNVRLLRVGWLPNDAFTSNSRLKIKENFEKKSWLNVKGAEFYVGKLYENKPSWIPFVEKGAGQLPDLLNHGCGGVLFLPVANRIMVVCFGSSHNYLDTTAFEKQFGLKVTLNVVPKDQIRTMDTAIPDAVTLKRRVQASKSSEFEKFGINTMRDLAQVAGGTPRDKSFGSLVTGKDVLSITCEVTPQTLYEKCCEIFEVYNQTTYQEEYPWIDNMRLLTEKDIIKELDEKLFHEINALRIGKNSILHLTRPEINDYLESTKIRYYGFGRSKNEYNDVSINDYVLELNKKGFNGDFNEIKNKHKVQSSGDNEKYVEYKIYDCFVVEISKDDNWYILFSGSWYCVSSDFKDEIEKYYEEIPKIEIIGKTYCQNEQELIQNLSASRSDLIKLDRQKINPKDVKNANLEPCDFYTEKKEFIHLKDGHSSAILSHLWSQGLVSLEAFLNDAKYRNKLKMILESNAKFKVEFSDKNLKDREEYTVVFGIMRKPSCNNTLSLPFFSKVSCRVVVEKIRSLGVKVAIEIIEKLPSEKKII